MSKSVKMAAVPWFRKEDWPELKQLCPPGDLQETYEEWLANAQQGLQAEGYAEHDIQKVILTTRGPPRLESRQWRGNQFPGPRNACRGSCGCSSAA
jgi:hypothetical protein